MLSLAAVSHGIVLIFVAVSAVILCLVWIDRRRFVYAITTGATTLLLSAWWVGPFLFGHEFMTDMKYGFRPEGASDSFFDMFFPLTAPLDILITTLAIIGFVAMIMRRNLNGTALGSDRPGLRRARVHDPRQPPRHRAALEPAAAARSSISCATCS